MTSTQNFYKKLMIQYHLHSYQSGHVWVGLLFKSLILRYDVPYQRHIYSMFTYKPRDCRTCLMKSNEETWEHKLMHRALFCCSWHIVWKKLFSNSINSKIVKSLKNETQDTDAHLGDIVGSVSYHHNKASIAVKWILIFISAGGSPSICKIRNICEAQ